MGNDNKGREVYSPDFSRSIGELLKESDAAAEAAIASDPALAVLRQPAFYRVRWTVGTDLRWRGKETHGFACPFGDLEGPPMGNLRF